MASPAKYRWNVSPDGEGKMHLIDTQPEIDDMEPFFNAEVDTAFLLFTRSNPIVAQRITWTQESLGNSNFNPTHPVRFLIHGWNSGASSGANIAPTASYLQLGDFNVIVYETFAKSLLATFLMTLVLLQCRLEHRCGNHQLHISKKSSFTSCRCPCKIFEFLGWNWHLT